MNLFELAAVLLLNKKQYDEGLKEAEGQAKGFAGKFGSAAKTIVTGIGAAIGAAATGIGYIVKESLQAYAEYEQVSEGAKLIWGDAFATIHENAKNAFSTVQMSATDYYQQVNGLAVALKDGLNGDAQAAAELSAKVIQAQADVVAAMGISQEAAQNAVNGIVRGQYQMLDNLQIGIKATKSGVQDMIDSVNEYNAVHGKATQYTIDNYADVYSALVDYIEMQGLAGYAANEATSTIQGSLSALKAAWQNLLVGFSDKDADIGQLITDMVTTGTNALNNILPVVEQVLSSIGPAIETLIPQLITLAVNLITTNLPQLIEAAIGMVTQFGQAIIANSHQVVAAALQIINTIAQALSDPNGLLGLIDAAFVIVSELANGIAENLPTLLPAIVGIVLEIVGKLTSAENISMLINSAVALMNGLADGIVQAIPVIIAAIPTILQNIVNSLVQNAFELKVAALQMQIQLAVGMIKAIPEIIKRLPEIVDTIKQGFIDLGPELLEAGKSLMSSLWDGVKSIFGGKKNDVNVSEGFDFNTVQVDANSTASVVTGALNGIAGSVDASAVTTNFETQFNSLSQSAETTSTAVSSAFNTMGTSILNSVSTAASTSDWTSVETSAKIAVANIKAEFEKLPNICNNVWNKCKDVFREVPTHFRTVFTNAVNNIKSAWSTLPSYFASVWAQIRSTINTSEAYTWGADLMLNMASGITSNISAVTTAATTAAAAVKNILGFSEPEEGPLSDFHTYAPDMMDLFIAGIKANANKLRDQVAETFDFRDLIENEYGIGIDDLNSNHTITRKIEISNSKTDDKLDQLMYYISMYLPQLANMQMRLDSGALVGELTPGIDVSLGGRSAMALRGNAV